MPFGHLVAGGVLVAQGQNLLLQLQGAGNVHGHGLHGDVGGGHAVQGLAQGYKGGHFRFNARQQPHRGVTAARPARGGLLLKSPDGGGQWFHAALEQHVAVAGGGFVPAFLGGLDSVQPARPALGQHFFLQGELAVY